MTKKELIISNLIEIRRRSIILWQGLPKDYLLWQPDESAMTAIEMIRHVLQADFGWNIIINRGDMTNYTTPWDNRKFYSISDEIEFAKPYRQLFLESINKFSEDDLSKITVVHPGNGKEKILGEYLLRIGYHESVHAGQFLSYLRAMNVDRPFIWD